MKTLEADIVVVAAGPAGLAAAISAAEKNASVIVFEKEATTGGAGGLIIDSTMGLPDESKPENVQALTKAVHEYGWY